MKSSLWLAFSIASLILINTATAAISVTTNAASGIDAGTVTFNGTITGVSGSAVVWFEYGGHPSSYKYKTTNQTLTGNGVFLVTLTGMPFISGRTYYYRAVGADGAIANGAQQSFTTSTLTTLSDYDFDEHFDELTNSELKPANISQVGASPYVDRFGQIFWGLLFTMIFGMMWMRQDDVTIPTLVGMIIGGTLWASMPPDWTPMAMSLTIVCFGGLMYSILKARA